MYLHNYSCEGSRTTKLCCVCMRGKTESFIPVISVLLKALLLKLLSVLSVLHELSRIAPKSPGHWNVSFNLCKSCVMFVKVPHQYFSQFMYFMHDNRACKYELCILCATVCLLDTFSF